METSIHDPITFHTAPFHLDVISDCILVGCCGTGLTGWCGSPLDDDVFCADCRRTFEANIYRAEHLASGARLRELMLAREAMAEWRSTCHACGDPSEAAICAACASTGEYCSCGGAATVFVAVGAHRQPVCSVCAGGLAR
jgi:hypothetical protein